MIAKKISMSVDRALWALFRRQPRLPANAQWTPEQIERFLAMERESQQDGTLYLPPDEIRRLQHELNIARSAAVRRLSTPLEPTGKNRPNSP